MHALTILHRCVAPLPRGCSRLLGDMCTYMRVLRASRAFWGRSRTTNPAEGYR